MTPENAQNLRDLFAALAEAAGVDAFAPEPDGRLAFALDDMGVAIGAVEAPAGDRVWTTLIVGEAPSDPETLTFLLEQNYQGVGSGGGAFSVERESGAVVLHRIFPLPMDPALFVADFRRLAGAARAARSRLAAVVPDEGLASLRFIAV